MRRLGLLVALGVCLIAPPVGGQQIGREELIYLTPEWEAAAAR